MLRYVGSPIARASQIISPQALTITPAAGSGVNIVLSTTGDLAVNTDQLYVDTSAGNVGIGKMGPATKLDVNGIITVADANGIDWGSGSNSLRINSTYGQMVLNLDPSGTTGGNQFIIGDYQGSARDYDHETPTNPTLFIHSAIDPDTDNTRWMSLSHTGTAGNAGYGLIDTGSGNLVLQSTSGNVGIGTTLPTNLLSLGGDSARIFWMERNSVANTVGNTLTMQAGGATVSAIDKAGGDLILVPGASTGTGRANVRLRNYSRATATGTADNTAVDRLIVAGAVALTDAATSMFEVALAAGTSAGGCIIWTIRASDGTDMQAYTGITMFSAVNKAGVYTKTVTSDVGNDAKAVSAGTLTATFDILDGTNKVTVRCTPVGSLTESTYYQMSYTLFNNSPQQITVI